MKSFTLLLAIVTACAGLQATPLRREHTAHITADGAHSSPWGPENVLDGNPERGWITLQGNSGWGWGRHWIMLQLHRPLEIRSVALLEAQNAYSNGTYRDAYYAVHVRSAGKWLPLGAQTVPADLEAETKKVELKPAEPLMADMVLIWVSWDMEREVAPADRTARLRYGGIGEVAIDAAIPTLERLRVPNVVEAQDVLVEAELGGVIDPACTYELSVQLASLTGEGPACSAAASIPTASRRATVRMDELQLPDASFGEYLATVSLLEDGAPVWADSRMVLLRGREMVNPDAAALPEPVRPGDQILLTDMGRLVPQSALVGGSTPGKWWRRNYRTQDGVTGQMVCVVGRDPDEPEAWLAPPLSINLPVTGEFEIWLLMPRTYRGTGIDIKLSGDESWQELETMMVSRYPGGPAFKEDCLMETYWGTRRLDGDDLIIRQPHGTFGSFPYGFCEAYFAGVRLVKVGDAQAARQRAELRNPQTKRVVINNDGHGIFWMWEPQEMSELYRWVDNLAGHSVDHLELCVIAGGAFNYFSEVGETFGDGITLDQAPRLGDKRIVQSIQGFKARGIEPLGELIARGRSVGLPVYPSMRMDPFYGAGYANMFNGPFWKAHPELRIPGSPHVDYARPEVREYFFRIFRELLARFDVDGLSMDFTRHPPFFKADEPDKYDYMTEFVRRVRKEADRVGKEKGKHIALSVSFHGRSYQTDGLDVPTWIREGLVDCIAPELAPFGQVGWSDPARFVEMVRGTDCKLFGRIEHVMGGHDPRPSENDKVVPVREHRGPKDYEHLMLEALDAGMDGIYLFNQGGQWPALHRLGCRDELPMRVAGPNVFGVIEGPAITMDPVGG